MKLVFITKNFWKNHYDKFDEFKFVRKPWHCCWKCLRRTGADRHNKPLLSERREGRRDRVSKGRDAQRPSRKISLCVPFAAFVCRVKTFFALVAWQQRWLLNLNEATGLSVASVGMPLLWGAPFTQTKKNCPSFYFFASQRGDRPTDLDGWLRPPKAESNPKKCEVISIQSRFWQFEDLVTCILCGIFWAFPDSLFLIACFLKSERKRRNLANAKGCYS